MDARHQMEMDEEDEELAVALLPHQRMLLLLVLRPRQRAREQRFRRPPGSKIGKRGDRQRYFSSALHRLHRQYFGIDGDPPE